MQLLDISADLVSQLLPRHQLCDDPDRVQCAWRAERIPIVRPQQWFSRTAGWFHGTPRLPDGLLPQSWDVTSDTLAACVAMDLGAEELVLLKSADWGDGRNWIEAAKRGLVDAAFPRVVMYLTRVTWVNLRSGNEVDLRRDSDGFRS